MGLRERKKQRTAQAIEDAGLAEHLRARGDQGLLDAIRAWIVATFERGGLPDEREQRRRAIIDATAQPSRGAA